MSSPAFSRRPEASGASTEEAPSPGLDSAYILKSLLNLWRAVFYCVMNKDPCGWGLQSLLFLPVPILPRTDSICQNKKCLTCLDIMTTRGSRQRELVPTALVLKLSCSSAGAIQLTVNIEQHHLRARRDEDVGLPKLTPLPLQL